MKRYCFIVMMAVFLMGCGNHATQKDMRKNDSLMVVYSEGNAPSWDSMVRFFRDYQNSDTPFVRMEGIADTTLFTEMALLDSGEHSFPFRVELVYMVHGVKRDTSIFLYNLAQYKALLVSPYLQSGWDGTPSGMKKNVPPVIKK